MYSRRWTSLETIFLYFLHHFLFSHNSLLSSILLKESLKNSILILTLDLDYFENEKNCRLEILNKIVGLCRDNNVLKFKCMVEFFGVKAEPAKIFLIVLKRRSKGCFYLYALFSLFSVPKSRNPKENLFGVKVFRKLKCFLSFITK